ncbi:hypothetical protein [Pseudomonas sp. NA-150]|uniref:hypothetical protein n=1 Tax=Pseudomonas sp. NA-150 TaxID=3367525 RepID=UPI0037CCA49D
MKIFILATLLATIGVLNIGYYTYLEELDPIRVWFIKKHPTFQVEFYNIYAGGMIETKLEKLSVRRRNLMIDYCKYRLGIITELKTEEELERCKVGQYRSEF